MNLSRRSLLGLLPGLLAAVALAEPQKLEPVVITMEIAPLNYDQIVRDVRKSYRWVQS